VTGNGTGRQEGIMKAHQDLAGAAGNYSRMLPVTMYPRTHLVPSCGGAGLQQCEPEHGELAGLSYPAPAASGAPSTKCAPPVASLRSQPPDMLLSVPVCRVAFG
jgi:hypothetical protein